MSTPAPSLRQLLSLAWPIMVSRSTQVVVGVCDAAMVAHLGADELAATTTGAFNIYAVLILPMGVTFIVQSFVSQLTARGDVIAARRYGVCGLVVAAVAGLLCLAVIPLVARVLALSDYSPTVRALMSEYLCIRLLSGGAAIGVEALANYYGGTGDTRTPMVANVIAMLLNLLGNWLLIDGGLGAPALGVAGAAWASAASSCLAFAGLLVVFLRDAGSSAALFDLRSAELLRLVKFGLPSGFNWFFEFFAFNFFVNVVVAGLGTLAVGALMTVFQLNSVAFMPAFGLASAGAILAGQAIGATRIDDVPRILKVTAAASIAWQGLLAVIYVLMPALVLGPFVPGGEAPSAFVALGARMLLFAVFWQLFDALATALAEILRAAGDTLFTLWARIALGWAVFVPGSYLTVRVFGGGDVGALVWIVAYLALLALVLLARFRGGRWRRIDLVGTEHAPVIA